jgi:hypothetical protein
MASLPIHFMRKMIVNGIVNFIIHKYIRARMDLEENVQYGREVIHNSVESKNTLMVQKNVKP